MSRNCDGEKKAMAQTQHQPMPSINMNMKHIMARSDHSHTHPGPQLPPLHSLPPPRSACDDAGRPFQLPPMQVQGEGLPSPPRPPTRSIPVAQLLSSHPPEPLPRDPPPPTFPPSLHHQHHQRPSSGYSTASSEYRLQGSLPPPPSQHVPSRFDHASISYRQPPSIFQQDHYPRQHYVDAPSIHADRAALPRYSPGVSAASSPHTTHSVSESSPRSSLPPGHPSAFARQKPRAKLPPLKYTLSMRQQPVAARACGFGERDRRVIDPPPILELKTTDMNGMPEQDHSGMFALHAVLLSPDGNDDETELPPAHPDMPSTQRLMGSLVASPYQAKDENGVAGTFFVFPDLSCRSPGKYRLHFKLIRVDPSNMEAGASTLARITTDVFSVFTAKDFPGMRASSGLLKALRRQGLNVGVKKGSEARKGKSKAKKEAESDGSSSEGEPGSDDDDSGSASASPKVRSSKKKGKRRKREE